MFIRMVIFNVCFKQQINAIFSQLYLQVQGNCSCGGTAVAGELQLWGNSTFKKTDVLQPTILWDKLQ